ncbi:N-acetyltransferase 9-like protein [Gryllus bimaculatus]|nr:N-acetyltransferase 9-like protein [Gryllus bimaculatus]
MFKYECNLTSYHFRYHEWMKSKELQELTASEELSLEEEYKMQETWHIDDDNAMIGDTNLFLLGNDVAEAEIMIAEAFARGKGRGKEAMLLMLKYGCDKLCIKKYIAKIGTNNSRSITMFQNMGFIQVSESNVFKEVTLEKHVTDEWHTWLNDKTNLSLIAPYT